MIHAPKAHDTRTNGATAPRRPRVLLGAFSCGPNLGSEPGIGWWRAIEISRYCDTWVLTDANDWQARISDYLERHGPIPNLHFVFVPRHRWEAAAEYKPLLNYVAYRRWLRRAFLVAKRLHEEVQFDIVNQVTSTSFREPGYLHQLQIPFVWGPVGGAQNYPWRFLLGAGIANAGIEATRNVLNTLQMFTSPRVRRAAKCAAAIFASNSDLQQKFQRALGVDSTVLCDVGTSNLCDVRDESPTTRPHGGPLRLLWAGLQIPRKSLELLIEALALVPQDVPYELHVLGDGPCRQSWQALAQRREVDSHIRWLGQVPHGEAIEQMRWADCLVFTSLRDTTGTVLIEALAAAKPVICLDHQGAGEIVTRECGVKIPVTNRRDVQRQLCEAITLLQQNPRQRFILGQNARQRAARFLWAHQARRIAEEYNRVLGANGSDARCDLSVPNDSADGFSQEDQSQEPAAVMASATR
jgi:glycosyltransferase involved in cell wall biosynthesis